MSVERDRLISLIEFAHRSALLLSKPTASVSQHRNFSLHEDEIQGLPGIHLNVQSSKGEDDIWLTVDRLRESPPPEIPDGMLRPWVKMTKKPTEEPWLLEQADRASLIAEGVQLPPTPRPKDGKRQSDPDTMTKLSEYEGAEGVRAAFEIYLNTRWHPWASKEKLCRRTTTLYSKLFTLKQQLEGGIVETQLELVWGVGVGIWKHGGTSVHYPLITRMVDLSLNHETSAVEIRPRDLDARLEIDWYTSKGNPGVADLENEAKEFFGKAEKTFSPFDSETFETLLHAAATTLDANGIYWPDQVPAGNRKLPKPDDTLKVTNTWVLFARPHTNNLFLQDLEKLKKKVEENETFPPAVAAVLTDPDTTNPIVELPAFRGHSASNYLEAGTISPKERDLYFPKPFNEEQVRIVQLLQVSPGVVVQGPPGTGKTHTIANIICHYLAEGKRVLVTSLKDPALAVLREQLPDEIRPLAISMLTSEQEGMKQFERSIQKIAAEVQTLDRGGTEHAIKHLEDHIDALHSKLALTDRKIGELAKRNLTKIALETNEFEPEQAAGMVVANAEQFEWIPDALGVSPEFEPPLSNADIVRLREARRTLGPDITYLTASLPQFAEFPDPQQILEVHQDLAQVEKLKQRVEKGEVPALVDSCTETLELAQRLLQTTETLRTRRGEIEHPSRPWVRGMYKWLRGGGNHNLLPMLEALGAEFEESVERRKAFLERPVRTSEGIELDNEIVRAVGLLADGKNPFGLRALFRKSEQKRRINEIRVLGDQPTDAKSWKHVAEYLELLKCLRALAIRWNALAKELSLTGVPEDKPEDCLAAVDSFRLYLELKEMVAMEGEVCKEAVNLFPIWPHARQVADDPQRLSELEKAIRHHLTKNRLAEVWVNKERIHKVMEGQSGQVVEEIRTFLTGTLGNPDVSDTEMQTRWSALMVDLSRVLALSSHFGTVSELCDKVAASGAPKYAELLKLPFTGTVDELLPDNWRESWQLRRLNTYLESIDAHDELKRLTKDRLDVERKLSKAYRELVVKRTWLKLANNASQSIRAALQAYLNAIQKIGKGTGKRAVRYRQEARMAASKANPAVPCWIMAHYRVSETLPSELGCFDLVIIDEASQSDLTALPALLRAKKVLIVGDDKQVSPEAVGVDEESVRSLMNRFLESQVDTYRAQMSPERSICDLFKVVFAKSAVMLREHFRCVNPIIEYSKREFYNHEIRPLRVPRASERLDPPLVDVLVEDGYRDGRINLPEACFIVNEIKAIVEDPRMIGRSIGVVSLLASDQARTIWQKLADELGPEVIQRHRITCGDARTFQGKERDIMFLSMVSAPNEEMVAPLTREGFAQRFNVAASRARDRMYLVRSVELEHLSEADRFRRSLIAHFATPFAQDERRVEDLRKLCESSFESDMYDELTQRGYWVTPQVRVGQYRIDMVVEGHNDARIAVECDGDQYHGPDKWADDTQRQRILERAGWTFWRCFASDFIRRREAMLDDLFKTLAEHGVDSIGAEGAPRSLHTEHRVVRSVMLAEEMGRDSESDEVPETPQVSSTEEPLDEESATKTKEPPAGDFSNNGAGDEDLFVRGQMLLFPVRPKKPDLPMTDYVEYAGPAGKDPRNSSLPEVAEELVRIIEIEGPVIAKRVYRIYLRNWDIKQMNREIKSTMNKALSLALRQGRVVHVDEAGKGSLIHSVVRLKGMAPIRLRSKGPRLLEEIPPSELQFVARCLLQEDGFAPGSDEHLRAILECFDVSGPTRQIMTILQAILEKDIPYVEQS